MKWLERAVRNLVVRSVNASGVLLLQRVPIALRNNRSDFLALRRHWVAGKPKGNDLDMVRLAFLATNIAALEAAGVPGAFAELGVWRGNSAKVIHSLAPGRDLYLLDTFQGFPAEHSDDDPVSGISHHYQDVSVDTVRAFVGRSERIHFVVGCFPDSAGSIPFEERFAFVHIDCDLYRSVRAGLEYFYPRMSPKGLIVVHDYGSGRWPGVTKAVNEYLSDKPETPVLIPDTSGSAAIVRQMHGSPV
nr:TylF/MycF/NovP-related O-methyltransferase [uncultured Rhodopila sp.]